jgi:shikimate kinase
VRAIRCPRDEVLAVSRPNVIFVGFMGSGKTAIGRLAARALGFQFLDTDQLVVDRSQRQISEIFAAEGESFFRDLETDVIGSLSHLSRCVISTGGGAVLRERNRHLLRELGFVVCLTAREDVLFERVSRNDKRPLLQTADPRQTMRELLQARAELYRDTAHWTLDTSDMAHADVVEAVTAAAREAFAWGKRA